MRYFKPEEFACKCGCGKADASAELQEKLDEARALAGVPFIITSGCRCEKHNQKVGGVSRSSHVQGLAADIAINESNKSTILMALGKYFDRIGIASNFIHVDVDHSKPNKMWFY